MKILVVLREPKVTEKLEEPMKVICFCLPWWKPFQNDEERFFFQLKAFFVIGIFRFLSWLENGWYESNG